MVSDTQDNGNSTPPKDQPGSILDQANTIDDGSDQDSSKFRPGSVLYHLAKIGESNTTSHGAAILAALARFHNEKTGKCNPSHKALAKQSKYGERTIRKILKEDLADLVTYQHGKYSNEYTLFPPMLVSSPAPGTITVAHAEAAPTLGTRGPGEKSSHSAHGARFTRHTGPVHSAHGAQVTYKEHTKNILLLKTNNNNKLLHPQRTRLSSRRLKPCKPHFRNGASLPDRQRRKLSASATTTTKRTGG